MGDPLKGRYASVKLGSDLVQNFGRWSLNFDLDEIDVTVFGSVWKKSVPGFQGWGATVEGFYDPADTTGQLALQSDALSATKVTDLRFYINSDSYWTPDVTNDSDAGAYITGIAIDHDKAGVATVSFTVVGFGPLTLE